MAADEQKAFELLGRNRTFQKPIIEQHGGVLIKEIGDGIMASFPTVSDALNAAMRIQQECKNLGGFSLRIGIHYGEIIFENNDIFGDAVNIASRIQTLGVHGAVVFSKKVNDEIANKSAFRTSSLGSFEFKNVKNSIEVFALSNEGFPVPKRSEIEGRRKKEEKKKFPVFPFVILGIIIIIFLAYKYFQLVPKVAQEDKSIAVLPFVNMSGDAQQEYFSDGLSEELINVFTKLPDLKVIGRTSSFAFKGKNEDLRTIGEKLNVTYLLEGSVRKSNNIIRITAQLIKAIDGSHLWSETYDKKMDDIFEVQDQISKSVTEALKVTILNNDNSKLGKISPDAYNDFLKGRFYYEKTEDEANNERAMNWFNEAIKKDSSFSLPWTYLSMCYLRNSNNTNQNEFQEAKQAALKAFDLDSTSGIVAANVGEILENEYDFRGSLEKIELALKLEPENPYVLRNVARAYTVLGRREESIVYAKKALEKDPIQNTAIFYVGLAYYYAERFNDYIASYKQNVEGDEVLSRIYFACLIFTNNIVEAKKEAEQTSANPALKLFELTVINIKTGKKSEADKSLTQLIEKYPQRGDLIALAYAWKGESDKAMDYIERGYRNKFRGIVYLNVDPALKEMKNNIRFKNLLQKLDIPK